jgi:hypothetical protein
LRKERLLWNLGSFYHGNLTVPRNELYDIDGISAGEEVFPPPNEKPVICAINPLERRGPSAQRKYKGGNNVRSCSMNLGHSADNANEI